MKRVLISTIVAASVLVGFADQSNAQQAVSGYTRNNGTVVQPYYRSTPNNTTLDNYSTRGNTNPYTGAAGTRDPYPTPSYTRPTYQQPTTNQYGFRNP
jgi:hypothetical protein